MPYLQCITCPCCQLTSHHPGDAANGYCGRCHWWTSDPVMAPYHFALPCEHRGQGVVLPRLGAWFRETHIIVRPDRPDSDAAFTWAPRLPVEYPMPFGIDPDTRWLPTQPGTMLEISGHIRPRRRPWWRRIWQATRRRFTERHRFNEF